MVRGIVYIYFVGKPDNEHDRIHPESGEIVEWDEGGVVVTTRAGGRRIYPWTAVRGIYEDPPMVETEQPYWHSLDYPTFLDLAIEATDDGMPALEGSTDYLALGRLVAKFFEDDVAKAKADAEAAGVA